ncbi:MAG: pimeloyl-ACP methyl ester carboxylesterase [Gammaproteobacteria bacterium]|jgi:pimeloyl-ACP methyl ester carboxylesterase
MTWLEPEQAQFVDTKTLRVAYHELGPPSGPAVVLSHGFPYDVQAYVPSRLWAYPFPECFYASLR